MSAATLHAVGMVAAVRRTPAGHEIIDPGTVSHWDEGALRLAREADEAFPGRAKSHPVIRAQKVLVVSADQYQNEETAAGVGS